MPFFSGEKLTGGYGGADIINSCTINVNRGEIVAILGPNGAGKSTAMKAMLGLLNLKSGKVCIDGKNISKLTLLKMQEKILTKNCDLYHIFLFQDQNK